MADVHDVGLVHLDLGGDDGMSARVISVLPWAF